VVFVAQFLALRAKIGGGLTVTARSVFLFGSGAALTWALMYLLHQFVLLTEPTARAGLF
jgi:hypothetical protein